VTNPDDTIVAISTPPGEGGVGIVRLSGTAAIEIADRLFRSSRGRSLNERERQVFHGHIVTEAGDVVDEVICVVMRGPHSYTREDVVEINGHGGGGPLNAIVEASLCEGARLAEPGEFTQRAFLNGRIDLVQAEAVIDQIRARTRANLQAANAAASGTLSRRLHAFAHTIRTLLARVEAAVDFPEDDLPDLIDAKLLEDAGRTRSDMASMLAKSDAGRILRDGATLAIAGRPNVGKSSLFNSLLRDARAIVSAQAGTTRDRIEEYITLGGVPVKLVDTAGVRQTDDEIEQIGVRMARETLQSAQLALLVVDGASAPHNDDEILFRELEALEIPVVVALNKSDLVPTPVTPIWAMTAAHVLQVSALTGDGLEALEAKLGKILLGGVDIAADEALINRLHQKDSLRRATECLARFLDDMTVSPEFLAVELQEALQALGEITGETTPDDILEMVFGAFCIGK
jgi:tRNA modification GTPase